MTEEQPKTVEPTSEKEEQNDEDDLFPFKMVGDTKKKSDFLGSYNFRYIELDSVKGVLKRYFSAKEYPKHPKEIIDIRNFNTTLVTNMNDAFAYCAKVISLDSLFFLRFFLNSKYFKSTTSKESSPLLI